MINLQSLKEGHWPIFLISLLSAITNLLLPTALVRLLTPEEIGFYKIFFLYAQSIIFICLAGGPLYSVYYWIGKKESAKKYLGHAWLITLSLSLIFALLGFALIIPISKYLSLPIEYSFLLILSAITSAPAGFYGEYLTAKGERVRGSLFNSGIEILKAIIIVILVFIYRNIHAALWGYTILYFFKLILSHFFLYKEDILITKIDKDSLKDVWKYSAPMSYSGALSFIIEKIDMIVLSTRLNVTQFAFYSMGSLMIPPLQLLEMSVQKVLIPSLSKAFHDNDKNKMVMLYKKAQADIAYIIIPAVFGLIIFREPIIEILFTRTYLKSSEFLFIYAFTYLTYFLPTDSIQRATGNTKWVFKMYILITPFSILSVHSAAKYYGAKAALATSIFFMYVPKIPSLIYSSKVTEVKTHQLIAWKSLTIFTAINLMLMFICYLLHPYFKNDVVWFLVISPIYALVYLGSIHFLKHKRIYDFKE